MNTESLTNYAVDFILTGTKKQVIVVSAYSRDDAYSRARATLVIRRLIGASIQGTARPATQADIDSSI